MPGVIWSRFRNLLYDKQIIKSMRFPGFVISIGNLTWGGTGKTALALQLARFFLNRNSRVAILSRGYGRASSGIKVVSDGDGLKCSWEEAGDEAYLLAKNLPGAIVVVAEKRIEARSILEKLQPDVILLDDAFQHRKVARDLDIVLVDASEDLGSQRVIPFGKLRERPQSLSRADVVILTHHKQAHAETTRWFAENVKSNLFHANYQPEEPELFRGKRVAAFCGIGAPDHFFELLKQIGAEIVAAKTFRDHHQFSKEEIEEFQDRAGNRSAEWIVTTAKDAVRIDPAWVDSRFKVVSVKLQIDEEKIFYDFLISRIGAPKLSK